MKDVRVGPLFEQINSELIHFSNLNYSTGLFDFAAKPVAVGEITIAFKYKLPFDFILFVFFRVTLAFWQQIAF